MSNIMGDLLQGTCRKDRPYVAPAIARTRQMIDVSLCFPASMAMEATCLQ